MTRHARTAPVGPLPPGLLGWLSQNTYLASGLNRRLTEGPARPLAHYTVGDIVVDVASGEHGRRLLRLERRGRSWATPLAVPTPEILAHDTTNGSWQVSRLVASAPPHGIAYVENALSIAERIEHAVPPEEYLRATRWQGPRRTLATRLVRLTASAMPLTTWRRARLTASRLPKDGCAHGDFHPGNVLNTSEGVTVVDWEYLGPAPRSTDALRLWTTLSDPQDRALILEKLLTHSNRTERARLATLVRYLALRLLGENLTAPPRLRNPTNLAHAHTIAAEGLHLFNLLT